jgi:uncharacterized tellurite resistance protein B-like protein
MTSVWDWLRSPGSSESARVGDTDTVRRIVSELNELPPERARFLAAFAYVLSRVAGADQHFSEVETTAMAEVLRRVGHLPDAQALLVVEIAKSQNRLFGGTENFLVTREFREVATDGEREDLLHCLFAVAAADEAISAEEEAQIGQIAGELGFARDQFLKVRLAYSGKRTVLRRQ